MASELQQNNIKLKFLYDIACVVQKHVQVSSRINVYSLVVALIDLTFNLRGKICLTLCTMWTWPFQFFMHMAIRLLAR